MNNIDKYREYVYGSPENATIQDKTLVDIDFSKTKLNCLAVRNSTLIHCDFNKSKIRQAIWGSGPVTFESCIFDGAKIKFLVYKNVNLSNCSFRHTTLNHWNAVKFSMSDCIFSGKLQSCLFFGRDPDEHNGPPNIFEANDFSEAEFINSDFRWGVDLTRQKLPVGYNVFYSPDATTTITSAQDRASEVIDDKTRKNVFNILEVLAEKIEYGQEQLFVAEKSFTNISWPVLRAVLNGDDPNNPPQPPETTTPQKRAGAKPRTRKSRTRSGAMKPAERPTTEPASLSSASRNDDASNPVIETATRQLADPATLDQAITTLTGILKDPDADSALIDQATATLAALPTDGTSVHLDLANARLGHNATLTGLTITADSTFTGLTASEGLTITSCTFTGKADFTDLTANGPVTITNTTINGPAEFSRAEFNGPAAITRTIFNNYAMFDIATFADTLDLTQTQFWSDLSLEADFQAGVIFNQTMIEGNAKRSIPLELGINDQGLPPGTIWSPSGPFWEE